MSTNRLNVNLPSPVFSDIRALAKKTQLSVTNLIRFGFPILAVLFDEVQKGNKIRIVDEEGSTVKEVILFK